MCPSRARVFGVPASPYRLRLRPCLGSGVVERVVCGAGLSLGCLTGLVRSAVGGPSQPRPARESRRGFAPARAPRASLASFRLLVAAGGAERQRAGARVGGTVHLLVRGASLCAAFRADRVQPRQQHGLLAKRRSSSRGPSRCRAFLVHRPFRERASRVPWSAELIYCSIFRRRGQFVARSSSSSRRRAEVLWCVFAWAWPRAARPSSQVGFSIRPAAPGLRRHLRMGSVAATPGS